MPKQVSQSRSIACPYCNWQWIIRTVGIENEEMARVAAGTRDFWTVVGSDNKPGVKAESLDDANQWVDHTCSNCKQTYQYNRKTGEVRQ